jgi:hypothetical protein
VDTDIDRLRRLGGLRDATIEEVVWRKADRSLRLIVTDVSASGVVTLVGIENLAVETGLFRGVFRLSGIDVEERRDGLDVRIGLAEPGADLRLRCKQVKVAIDES